MVNPRIADSNHIMPVLGAKTMPPTRMICLSLYLLKQMISWQMMIALELKATMPIS
jgi:hypothetical protein